MISSRGPQWNDEVWKDDDKVALGMIIMYACIIYIYIIIHMCMYAYMYTHTYVSIIIINMFITIITITKGIPY